MPTVFHGIRPYPQIDPWVPPVALDVSHDDGRDERKIDEGGKYLQHVLVGG